MFPSHYPLLSTSPFPRPVSSPSPNPDTNLFLLKKPTYLLHRVNPSPTEQNIHTPVSSSITITRIPSHPIHHPHADPHLKHPTYSQHSPHIPSHHERQPSPRLPSPPPAASNESLAVHLISTMQWEHMSRGWWEPDRHAVASRGVV
jgi:hypothetical protein